MQKLIWEQVLLNFLTDDTYFVLATDFLQKKIKNSCLCVSPSKIHITIPGELYLHRIYQMWSFYLGCKCIITTLKEVALNHWSWEYLNYLKYWHISTEITHSMYGLCQNQGLNGRKMKILLPCQVWLHNKENNET